MGCIHKLSLQLRKTCTPQEKLECRAKLLRGEMINGSMHIFRNAVMKLGRYQLT